MSVWPKNLCQLLHFYISVGYTGCPGGASHKSARWRYRPPNVQPPTPYEDLRSRLRLPLVGIVALPLEFEFQPLSEGFEQPLRFGIGQNTCSTASLSAAT